MCSNMPATGSSVRYVPGDSASAMFGGNSNWRGPIWMPVNFLIIESLQRFHSYYGDDFKIECPVGSGTMLHLGEVAAELSRRLCRIFLRDEEGRRPVFGDSPIEQNDPHFRDNVLFYEYLPRRHRPRPRRLAPDRLDRPDRATAGLPWCRGR